MARPTSLSSLPQLNDAAQRRCTTLRPDSVLFRVSKLRTLTNAHKPMTDQHLNLDEAKNHTQLALEAVEGSDQDTVATQIATVCLTLAEILISAAQESDSRKA